MVMSSLNSRSSFDHTSSTKLKWNVSCSDESGDDEEQLTSLVRSSYLKHLKRCLSKNYEKSVKSNISIDELDFCSEMLEKKALRSCMVTSIYQRKMAQIIKEIKEATQNDILHNGFQKKLNSFENNKCDKETQTIDEHFDIKKEISKCNDLEVMNTNTNKINNNNNTKDPEEGGKMHNTNNNDDKNDTDVADEDNNSNSSYSNSKTLFLETFGETEAVINQKLEQDENGVDTYEELLNILLSSPKKVEPPSKQFEEINSIKQMSPLCKKRKLQNGEYQNSLRNEQIDNMNIDNIVVNERIPSHNGNISKHTVVEKVPKPNFKVRRSLLVNWSYELFVQNTHLENILSKLKPHKRIVVEKRFKDLFGNDIIPENKNPKISNLSEEELSLCRKRIAGIVVGELTPFYVEGKIGSRPVFKNLAKKLTDDIMCTTLTPDPESIRSTVQGMFIGDKHINSLKDAF